MARLPQHLLPILLLSGCVTGFDGEEYQEYRRITDKLNENTRQLKEAEFRRKQEAYYDQQLRKGN